MWDGALFNTGTSREFTSALYSLYEPRLIQTPPVPYELLQEFSYPVYFSCRCHLFHVMAFIIFIDRLIWGLFHIFP